MPRLGELLEVLDGWYVPQWAQSWDAVGLVCGDPGEPVGRVLLAVDPVPATIVESVDRGADLLITHHPLLLTPVHGVPASDPKGALVHRMIRAGVAHVVAHTNADVALHGVSDALAGLFELHDTRPLDPQDEPPLHKLVVYVPAEDTQRIVEALASAGAGRLGDYERCAWWTQGHGTFRALPGSNPTIGSAGLVTAVDEARVEMVVPQSSVTAAVAAVRAAHPYEEPAFDVLNMAPVPSRRGTGRVGRLAQPVTLAQFAARAAAVLPATVWGVRAAGDGAARVETVAVCGGSGGSLIEQARSAGADVFLTADLKHHPALEAVSERGPGPALVDAAHWATEAPWLDVLALRLRQQFGTTVDVLVSRQVTDPWTLHAPSTSG